MNAPRAAVLAAACALAGCAPRATVVSVDGWAASDAARSDSASRRAVADALRRAIERASGVRISARTRVRDGVAISARVVADASGCVLSYKVLSEKDENGGRAARVRAKVAIGPGSCAGRPAPPELAAVSITISGNGEAAGDAAARAAEAALRAELSSRGWNVVEGDAPLRLVGSAAVRDSQDPRLHPLYGCSADLTLRVETSSRRVLRAASATGGATDIDPAGAARRAGRAAAVRAAAAIGAPPQDGAWELAESD